MSPSRVSGPGTANSPRAVGALAREADLEAEAEGLKAVPGRATIEVRVRKKSAERPGLPHHLSSEATFRWITLLSRLICPTPPGCGC